MPLRQAINASQTFEKLSAVRDVLSTKPVFTALSVRWGDASQQSMSKHIDSHTQSLSSFVIYIYIYRIFT